MAGPARATPNLRGITVVVYARKMGHAAVAGSSHRDFHVWCIGRSVDEGRKAAMRWLIEFVGVIANDNGDPIVVKPHKNGKSVTIQQVGGSYVRHEQPRCAQTS